MRAQTRDAVVTRSPGRPVSCRSKLVRHTSLPIEGGLGGPLRASPKGPMAPAKPALELGFSDRLLVPVQFTSPDSVLGRDQFSSTRRPPSGLVWLATWTRTAARRALVG